MFTMAQSLILQKIASYFKLSKKNLKLDTFSASSQDNLILESGVLAELGFNKKLYCVSGKAFSLNSLVNIQKLRKSELYEQFLYGETALRNPKDSPNYMLAWYGGGVAWFMYRADNYSGPGGWMVSEEGGTEGFVIEPVVNYLAREFPKEE